MDHTAADVDLLQGGRNLVLLLNLLVKLLRHPRLIIRLGDHTLQDLQRDDVGIVGIGVVTIFGKGAEHEHVGLHRMGRVHGHDLQPFMVVPGVGLKIPDIEVVVEIILVDGEEHRQLLGHRSPNQWSGKIFNPVPGPDQGGNTAKMVVVGMGMEDPLYLADPYSQGFQTVEYVGTGVDKVQSSLIHEDTGHAGPVDVPAVTFAGVDNAEIFTFELVLTQRIRSFIAFTLCQIEIDGDGLALIVDFKNVHLNAADGYAVTYFHLFVFQGNTFQETVGCTDAAEGELELQAHHLCGFMFRHTGLHDLLF